MRQAERGGCVKRMTLCNRGQPLYTLATGTSRGADGGGGFQVSKMAGGEPFIAVGSWSLTLRSSVYAVNAKNTPCLCGNVNYWIAKYLQSELYSPSVIY